MTVTRLGNAVCKIAVVGEKDQTAGVLVEAPDRVDALPVVQKVNDVIGIAAVRGALDTLRFVACKQNVLLLLRCFLPGNHHLLSRHHAVSRMRNHAVDGNLPGFHQTVRLAT